MDKPNRPQSHVLARKSSRYLENIIPDEWHFNIPTNDYGIDYQVEISLNEQVTGLNFSIQLKSTAKTNEGDFAKISLKRTTLNYYKVRLEPVMLILYDAEVNEAYWSWISEFDIDLSRSNDQFTLAVPKSQKLSEINWADITNHVQHIFNAKSFISDFDICKIESNLQLAAWKTYYDEDYEQAVYLFGRLIKDGINEHSLYQALSWSFYQTYRYNEALNTIDALLQNQESNNSLKIKACILAESGFRTETKAKLYRRRTFLKGFLLTTIVLSCYSITEIHSTHWVTIMKQSNSTS
jgi:hypothetical protein